MEGGVSFSVPAEMEVEQGLVVTGVFDVGDDVFNVVLEIRFCEV